MTTSANIAVFDNLGTFKKDEIPTTFTVYPDMPADYDISSLRELKSKPTRRKFKARVKFWDSVLSFVLMIPAVVLFIMGIITTSFFISNGYALIWVALWALSVFMLPAVVFPEIKQLCSIEFNYFREMHKYKKTSTRKFERTKQVVDFSPVAMFLEDYRYYEFRLGDKLKGDSRYHATAVAAGKLVNRIRNNPAWNSEFLDSHRARLDLNKEYNQLIGGAGRLMAMSKKMGIRPTGESETVKRASAIWDSQQKTLEAVWESLVDRLKSMYNYYKHLEDLSTQISALASLEQYTKVQVEIEDLIADQAINGLAIENFRDLSDEITALEGAMLEVLGMMHSDVSLLSKVNTATIAA